MGGGNGDVVITGFLYAQNVLTWLPPVTSECCLQFCAFKMKMTWNREVCMGDMSQRTVSSAEAQLSSVFVFNLFFLQSCLLAHNFPFPS